MILLMKFIFKKLVTVVASRRENGWLWPMGRRLTFYTLVVFMPLSGSLPHWIELTCVAIGYYGNDSVWLSRLSHKRHVASSLLSWINCCVGRQLLSHKDGQAVLWRCPCGAKLRPSANRQHHLASHMRETSWKKIFHPREALALSTVVQVDILTATSWETLRQNHLAKPFPISTETMWYNKCLLFQSTKFSDNLLCSKQ